MKRATPIKTITYMALMAALNILFALMSLFVPLAGLFLAIALPLTSALVAIHCDIRYYPIYFVATLGLSLLVTMQQLETTLFYIFPSLILGLAFGWLFKVNGHEILILIFTSLVQLALLYLTILMINGLFQIDFVSSLRILLNIDSEPHISIIMPSILYVISLSQTTITYIVIMPELKKMSSKAKDRHSLSIYAYIASFIVAAIIIPLGFLMPAASYVLLGPTFMIAGTALYEFTLGHQKKLLFFSALWFVLSIFIVAVLFPLLDALVSILLVILVPLGFIGMKIIDFYLPMKISRYKIKPRGKL